MPRTGKKYALQAIICIVLFLIFIKQEELSNSTYNEDVKKESYSVKVMSIKKVREYYVTGIDTQGRHRKLVISPKWNLREVQVGDSMIKNANSYDDTTGLYSRAETETITVNCNVQPLDTKTDLDEHGKLIDAEYKIYCDSNSFITSDCMVTYNDKQYKIEKITDWDYYYIVYIKAVI